MKPTFAHDVLNSFFLWFDNFAMKKGDAYVTYTTKLYPTTDDRLGAGKIIYASPYKQWVYDKSITGATIPSGFTIDGSFKSISGFCFSSFFSNPLVLSLSSFSLLSSF